MPGHEMIKTMSITSLLDRPAIDSKVEPIGPPIELEDRSGEESKADSTRWSVSDRESHMASLIQAAFQSLEKKLGSLPQAGDFELTNAQVRVLHAALQQGDFVWAHRIFATLLKEGDEPSEQAVRNSLERLAKYGLLARSKHPEPSPDGAARWVYEVIHPAADLALDRERYRRLLLVEKLGGYPEELRHVLMSQTLDNAKSASLPEQERNPAGIG